MKARELEGLLVEVKARRAAQGSSETRTTNISCIHSTKIIKWNLIVDPAGYLTKWYQLNSDSTSWGLGLVVGGGYVKVRKFGREGAGCTVLGYVYLEGCGGFWVSGNTWGIVCGDFGDQPRKGEPSFRSNLLMWFQSQTEFTVLVWAAGSGFNCLLGGLKKQFNNRLTWNSINM